MAAVDLHKAARTGNVHLLRVAAKASGFDINAVDDAGRTCLHEAAEFGHDIFVQALLDSIPAPNASLADRDGLTALHLASQGGRLACIQKLVVAPGIDVDAADGQGTRALHFAARGGHRTSVRSLLHAGAAISGGDTAGDTALHFAARGGHPVCVKELLQRDAWVDQSCAPLLEEVRVKQLSAVHKALQDWAAGIEGPSTCSVHVTSRLKRMVCKKVWVKNASGRSLELFVSHKRSMKEAVAQGFKGDQTQRWIPIDGSIDAAPEVTVKAGSIHQQRLPHGHMQCYVLDKSSSEVRVTAACPTDWQQLSLGDKQVPTGSCLVIGTHSVHSTLLTGGK